MKNKIKWGAALFSAIGLISVLIFFGKVQPDVANSQASKVVFYVS